MEILLTARIYGCHKPIIDLFLPEFLRLQVSPMYAVFCFINPLKPNDLKKTSRNKPFKNKIPSEKSRQAALRRSLIPTLKG
jgi:hypothetical protein